MPAGAGHQSPHPAVVRRAVRGPARPALVGRLQGGLPHHAEDPLQRGQYRYDPLHAPGAGRGPAGLGRERHGHPSVRRTGDGAPDPRRRPGRHPGRQPLPLRGKSCPVPGRAGSLPVRLSSMSENGFIFINQKEL